MAAYGDCNALVSAVRHQNQANAQKLASQQQFYELKKKISVSSKKNFTVEREVRNLDQKIALLIRNRISLEEVMVSSGDISLINRTITLKDKREKQLYGRLFYILQNETTYIASLARLVKLGEIDNLLQTVMFTLYGNQYDESEEHLLLSMFEQVLRAEFTSAKSTSNLLRSNTALTRMMTTYTRRGPGQQYLKVALTNVLTKITSDADMVLEINPLKVFEAMINKKEAETGVTLTNINRKPTAEEAAKNPEVQAIIKPRITKLKEITDDFLTALIKSLDSVPYGIRWICRQIRGLTVNRFPDATREQICSLIGGFYLLRFVNPAIVTPQAFMLVETKLSANTRRNLTLLAKVLQNLANNVQFGGVKEFFMAPLNAVLDSNKARVNEFMERLTDVTDLDKHLNLDKYIALGRTQECVINISLNEMYFVHALFNQHLDAVCNEGGNHNTVLRKILTDLGVAPPQLPRKENANVDLVLERSLDSEVDERVNGEQLYSDSQLLLLTLVKSLPPSVRVNSIRDLIDKAEQGGRAQRNEEAVQNCTQMRSNCKKLVEMSLLSEGDNYDQLRIDAFKGLKNFEEQLDRVESDMQRLKAVLSNIHEHNHFLQQQLKAYKEYLENVRKNCGSASKDPKEKEVKKDKKVKAAGGQMKKMGPFKFSHKQLENDGVIMTSDVPSERRGGINFSFSCQTPGIFDVNVAYKFKNITQMQLKLDDLLEMQHNNQVEFETDFLKLNVNLLIYLLNKHFMA
uniref:Ras-GAP domain-containing protein n=1 Tax=Paramoeba aestuarina TaxID=180227 RepID=A0A7S4PCN8_9EUKA|mmetsp:Transcript_40083/g.63383  ORF Transcript_40083/g.63383 Transcript_40083/m.63383 type:complete len:745 (+) Transcript_40083:118-2352(+)|eukprot:CAMPEP_0201507062 /NCGR_PEP_ID=MMETSP0161_2-20130828/853_1 /ASSEMBLY_ACC=CAM_ASM_000251 /TAXON_ID=180227 /ORGANISM="Neoparamoeba aestuarina, Strain SoJaBio B1-5/56/2" /LENGTH=744 /DNA_ID=CAMNT_0047901333 /DNA_START=131 /DNA_END=2365 /DNA_ORIENTATION=-